jgi:hypothetical protein
MRLPHEPIVMHTYSSRSTRPIRKSYAECIDCAWRRDYEPGVTREWLQQQHDAHAQHHR